MVQRMENWQESGDKVISTDESQVEIGNDNIYIYSGVYFENGRQS